MKILTALLLSGLGLSASAQTLTLKAGDFVKGEFYVPGPQEADLTLRQPHQPARLLVKNLAAGRKEFMFVAQGNGEAEFTVSRGQTPLAAKDYQIRILQQIPLAQQIPPARVYDSPTMQRLAENLKTGDAAALSAQFWRDRETQGTPLIEPVEGTDESIVTFLWREAKNNVWLWGAPSSDHDRLERFADTDIWFKSYRLSNDSFLSYGLASDVPVLPVSAREQRRAILATLQSDPLNQFPYPTKGLNRQDKFSYYSSLRLKDAPNPAMEETKEIAQGTVENELFHSSILNNSRRIGIYTPPHFDPQNQRQILLFVFDGSDYQDKLPLPQILDTMIAAQQIPPVIAVFIDNPSVDMRAQELPPNADFAAMTARELQPWVEQRLHIRIPPQRTAIMGSSYGGLAAAYIAGEYPDVFGNALILSGSFWWQPSDSLPQDNNFMAQTYAVAAQKPIRFFISAGRYEKAILDSSRHLKDVLRAKNYPLIYKEYASDHSYFAWQYILREGLWSLFGDKHQP